MRLLIDTHALAWWFDESDKFSATARELLLSENTVVFVSAVSVYEAAAKHRLGKWPDAAALLAGFDAFMRDQLMSELPLTINHARVAGELPPVHRDPFDRMLAAQALVEDLTIVSIDDKLDQFGVRRLW